MTEKDLNYIAKVEQAIAKKYGEAAIQNPSKFWDKEKEGEYLEQLRQKVIEEDTLPSGEAEMNGFFIPDKLINRDTNRTCPICNTYSFTKGDDVYMNKYECCYKCYVKHIERELWRPNDG